MLEDAAPAVDMAAKIRAAWSEAKQAEADVLEAKDRAVNKAIRCGQLMREQKDLMEAQQEGKAVAWRGSKKPTQDKFATWLEENFPDIPTRTAYRWMAASERAIDAVGALGGRKRLLLEDLSLSDILGATEAELAEMPEAALEWRQTFFDFTQDKTMKDILEGVLLKEENPVSITRAMNGKHAPGAGHNGEDRKDWQVYLGRNLIAVGKHLDTYERKVEEDPAASAKMYALLESAVGGGKVRIDARGETREVAGWPRSVCEMMAEILKERLKRRD